MVEACIIGAALWRRTMRVRREEGLYGSRAFVSLDFRLTAAAAARSVVVIGSQCTRAHVELKESCFGRLAFSHFD